MGDAFTDALQLIREDLKHLQAGYCKGETNLTDYTLLSNIFIFPQHDY